MHNQKGEDAMSSRQRGSPCREKVPTTLQSNTHCPVRSQAHPLYSVRKGCSVQKVLRAQGCSVRKVL